MEALEVLVINDGSRDRSSAIAHSYADRYPQTFRVIDKENGNYGSCINRGPKEATGKYIRICDADDWYITIELTKFINGLLSFEGTVDMIINNYTIVTDKGGKDLQIVLCRIWEYIP